MPQVSYAGLFPFCITPTDDESLVGDGTWYPLGFTKEEVCALYWKNKSYNISCTDIVSIDYSDGSNRGYNTSWSGIANYHSDLDTFVPTIETDFICANVSSKTMLWWDASETGRAGYYYLFGYEWFNQFNYSLTTNCYYYNNLYYPLLACLSPQGYITSSDFAIKNRGWTQAELDLVSVTATCTFLGRNIPVYNLGNVVSNFINDEGELVYVTGGTISGSLVVTLDTQWPYNP